MVKLSWRGFSFAFIFTTRKANTMEYFMCWHNQMDEIPCQHITRAQAFFKKAKSFCLRLQPRNCFGLISSHLSFLFFLAFLTSNINVLFESFMIKVHFHDCSFGNCNIVAPFQITAQSCILPVSLPVDYYYHSSKSTREETGKTHLCALT